jgi:hypothetical protein
VEEDRLPSLLALQQCAGNAAVAGLLAGACTVQRQEADLATPPGRADFKGAAPAGEDTVSKARTAWEAGVTNRERDVVQKLKLPAAGQSQMQDAATQLDDAANDARHIANQLGTVSEIKKDHAMMHHNGLVGWRDTLLGMLGQKTPADVGNLVADGVEAPSPADF